MAVNQAPACGPACERSVAREAGGIEGVAEEKVASMRPSMSPLAKLDVCVILSARCGPARELVPGGGPAPNKQGRAHRTGRTVHAAKAGLHAARTGSASAQAAQ